MYVDKERKKRRNRYTDMPWDDSSSDKWQQKRKQRLNAICDQLRESCPVPYAEFVAQLAITTGIRSHIIRTYLDEIKTAGLITIKDNTIYWNNENKTFESRV
jgi:hypothetical protein